MKLLSVDLVVFMALLNQGSSLKCYTCSTTPGVNDTIGCSPGKRMDDKFLVECKPAGKFCVTTNVTAYISEPKPRAISNIALSCQDTKLSGCTNTTGTPPIDYVVSCFTSCQKDGCNGGSRTIANILSLSVLMPLLFAGIMLRS